VKTESERKVMATCTQNYQKKIFSNSCHSPQSL